MGGADGSAGVEVRASLWDSVLSASLAERRLPELRAKLPVRLEGRRTAVSTAIENDALSAIENGTLRSGVTDP